MPMPTQTVILINRQTSFTGPATFYPQVVIERLQVFHLQTGGVSLDRPSDHLIGWPIPDTIYLGQRFQEVP